MKKLLGIVVLGLLWFNTSFSQILNLDNNLEIKIPNGYKLYEINISEIIKNDPNNEFVEWITDSGEDFGWENFGMFSLSELINQNYSFNHGGNFESANVCLCGPHWEPAHTAAALKRCARPLPLSV